MKLIAFVIATMISLDKEGQEILSYNQSVLPNYSVVDYVYDCATETILTNYYKHIDK